jgi:prepilin-type N-terminal cleavage/methylation domain-containing protein
VTNDPLKHSRRTAFTLIELLITVAIIATLLGLLMPALSSARTEGTKAKCLANLRSLGQAFEAYGSDDESGLSAPVHPFAETSWWYDGEYEWGGKTGLGVYGPSGSAGSPWDLREENRILNRYIFGVDNRVPSGLFECPTDTGVSSAPYNFDDYFLRPFSINKKLHEVTGTSYRLNNHIDFTGRTAFTKHFYGPYMRPKSRIPESSKTVILEEAVAEVAKWNSPTYVTMGWHRRANSFSVSFIDGHAGSIHLAGQNDALSSSAGYWILRGDQWRMDCYPERRILDRPRLAEP